MWEEGRGGSGEVAVAKSSVARSSVLTAGLLPAKWLPAGAPQAEQKRASGGASVPQDEQVDMNFLATV